MKAMSTIQFKVMLHMQHIIWDIQPNVQLKMGANVNNTFS